MTQIADHISNEGRKALRTLTDTAKKHLAVEYLRPEVLAFAHLMEQQLRANDHKPGWKNDNPMALLDRTYEEADELQAALTRACLDMKGNRERVGKEAADVANFALMIADVCGGLGEKACDHDWRVWPETDGQEQKCMTCGAYRQTPKGEKA